MIDFTIREGSIEEAVAISKQIPEFVNPHQESIYEARLQGVPHLILIAESAGKAIGFKVGYDRDKDGSFYSWMGGVLPAYRRGSVAISLAERQEDWAREHDFGSVRFKTRNKLKAMQMFALSRGFDIIGVFPEEKLSEYRIIMEKTI